MSVLKKIKSIIRKIKEILKMFSDREFWRILKEQMKDSFRNPIGM